TDCANGAKNRQAINSRPTTTAVKPVRPPAATPAEDSIYGVVDEVPKAAPATIAEESANNAFFRRGNLPSFNKPARCETPTSVPVESNRSTRKKTKITPIRLAVNKPSKFICRKVGANEGISPTTPWNWL